MTDDNRPDADPPVFSALLTPHRSLGRRGFIAVMAFVSIVSFTAGYVFYRIGAWPVVGFCGLDVLLIFGAFRLNYRAARAYEIVEVRPHEVLVRKVSVHGRVTEFRFNPVWLQLEVSREEDEGVTRITLRSHGRSLAIADFLNPDDRTSFAEAFTAAIAAARRGLPFRVA
eukprot:gene29091-32610_t